MNLKLWIRALRAPFFQAVIIPVLVGTAVAWYRTGIFYLGYFLLTLFGAMFVNAGTNLTNDYFDHESRADDINKEFTAFSGGSRVIQEGLISPQKIRIAALIFFALATVIGLYLVYARGWPILVIGILGVATGYFYTAAPLKLGYRGLGELITGINCGPLVVLGAYYIQARTLSLEALLVSMPVGFLIAAILYINQFPDYLTDKAAKKNNLVVIIGPEKAIKGFYLLLIAPYLVVVLGSALKIIHPMSLICLLSLPVAWKTAKIAQANYNRGKKLIPAMAGTIATHLLIGLLLSCGYLLAGIFKLG